MGRPEAMKQKYDGLLFLIRHFSPGLSIWRRSRSTALLLFLTLTGDLLVLGGLPSEGKTQLSEIGWRISFSGERFLGLIQEALGNPSGAGERSCPSDFCWGEFGGVVDILLSLSLYLWGNRRRERRRRWKMMGWSVFLSSSNFSILLGEKREKEKRRIKAMMGLVLPHHRLVPLFGGDG